MPVASEYVLWATDTAPMDIIVLDEGLNLVDSSWWPGTPYTRWVAKVPTAGVYWVLRQVTPKTGYSLKEAPPLEANQLRLRVIDPSLAVVVQDGAQRHTFVSKPQGVTKVMGTPGTIRPKWRKLRKA